MSQVHAGCISEVVPGSHWVRLAGQVCNGCRRRVRDRFTLGASCEREVSKIGNVDTGVNVDIKSHPLCVCVCVCVGGGCNAPHASTYISLILNQILPLLLNFLEKGCRYKESEHHKQRK